MQDYAVVKDTDVAAEPTETDEWFNSENHKNLSSCCSSVAMCRGITI